jgi:hypothetical protein
MKMLITLFFSIILFFFIGCSDDNNSDSNPFGPEQTSGSVTFQVSIQQDQQIGSFFHFKPSVDVKITKVVGVLNNQSYNIDGDPNAVMTVAEGFSITVSNPQAGDQWLFTITGKIASTGSDFTSTVNFTVPAGFTDTTNNVSFEIGSQAGQQGDVEFLFKPSVDVIILKVDVEMGGQTDMVEGDNTTIYNANTWYVLAGYNGVASGQKWTFKFTGKISGTNQDYSITIHY